MILNSYNGIASQIRHTNNMVFEKDVTDVFFSEFIQYQADEDGV